VATFTGLDILAEGGFEALRGKSVAVLCNQASISKDLVHVVDLLLSQREKSGFKVTAVFGPQHGLHGHTQDNMIEWEGAQDERTGVPVHSLYGESRQPSDEMLNGTDLLLVDLQDVGTRYYTFIWTMALCMAACERLGIAMLVLDRPNPIGGVQTEGPLMDPSLASFVGLHPLPARHGLTIAELAKHFQQTYHPKLNLATITMQGWSRSDYFDDLDLHWIPPSPNMPLVDTAMVYPGMCLLEATNLSEGRGTTRPFETFGAPWLEGWKLASTLNDLRLPGVHFRPVQFQPTFNKHQGELCGGCFTHVIDRRAFEPVLTAIAVLRTCAAQAGGKFQWKEPPYEYETEKRPIDILFGKPKLAETVLSDMPLNQIRMMLVQDAAAFEPARKAALLYPTS
jgi:uncharacterized protein YbbC (DUF1343 family)